MTNHGDDCYFFYYSTCTKGDSCPFRHCEAAMGNETVCSLWQEGRCFRTTCKFRHMEITKNRKEIPCYWENQPAGCQKPHCAFFHERPRYIDGVFVPPNRSLSKNGDEQPQEEPAPPPAAPLPSPANPQLRGVLKTETQEPVPSPTHPPVVINPADDDEDEDDQFSEEGEDGKVGLSPRKLPKSDDSLNFGVSTLEEIRLRKALKASMKKAGYPVQSSDTSANGEKENIHSFFSPAICDTTEETGKPRPSVADRLGRKVPNGGKKSGSGFPLKRSLAERLGGVVDDEESSAPPQKSLKPVKQRLGLPADAFAPTQEAGADIASKKASQQIHIKTLEEIRQEKTAKTLGHIDGSSAVAPEITKTKGDKNVKRSITVKDGTIDQTESAVTSTKKRRQEDPSSSVKKVKQAMEKNPSKSLSVSNRTGSGSEATNVGEVKVKTLEEIRKEKAVRMQCALEAENKNTSAIEGNGAKKPRLLCIKKMVSQSNTTSEKCPKKTEKPVKTLGADAETSSASGNDVKVKTFEEIMREKRLRKQEMEDQARTLAETEPEKQTSDASLMRNDPDRISPKGSLSPSSKTADTTTTTTSFQKFRKLISLKSKTATPLNSSVTSNTTDAGSTVNSVSIKHREPEDTLLGPRRTREKVSEKAGPQDLTDETPNADTALNKNQKMSPECTTETKVRPKLNVKPSVVKPAIQVMPGQKKKGAERSAVAAVKPLNSTSTFEIPVKEPPCRERQVFPSSSADAQMSSAVPVTTSTLPDSSPLREELQTVPVFKQTVHQEIRVAAPSEPCTVPQSSILKAPSQTPKQRRQSMGMSRTTSTSSAAASTSAVDDFEDLISEFADDHLEEDVDPGIGEDDLLQELSDMIDS